MATEIFHSKLGRCHVDLLTIMLSQQELSGDFIWVIWGGGVWKMHKTWFPPSDQAKAMGVTLNE